MLGTGWKIIGAIALGSMIGLSAPATANDNNFSGDPIGNLITGSLGKKAYTVSKRQQKRPKGKLVEGIDVSKFQGNINWKKVRKAGIKFAFIKATEGGDHKDKKFRQNWNGAAKAGIARGAYHFYYFCTRPEVQAKWFIKQVPVSKSALPPVLDMEWNHYSKTCKKRPRAAKVRADMRKFLKLVERHYGRKAVIYTSTDFHKQNLEGHFKDNAFWLRSVAAKPHKIFKGRKWLFWQWTGTGKVNGIRGKVDRNKFSGTHQEWLDWRRGKTHHIHLVRK